MYILLVEEDHFHATMISGVLKKQGYNRIKHIDNGVDCLLQVYEDITPDLVIMDSKLGRVNGVEVIEKLLRHKPGLKVIILTEQPNDKRISEQVESAVMAVIQKDDELFENLMPYIRIVHAEVAKHRRMRPVSNMIFSLKRFIFAP